jgi:threonine dehydrogenase-like Zn-dependent dehydrogenase
MIDLDDNRLAVAKRFGATATINSGDGQAVAGIMSMTSKRGVDTVIEAVGMPATFGFCEEITAPGGTRANIGVHREKSGPAPRTAAGPEHHYHHTAGRHGQHPHAAQGRPLKQDQYEAADHTTSSTPGFLMPTRLLRTRRPRVHSKRSSTFDTSRAPAPAKDRP